MNNVYFYNFLIGPYITEKTNFLLKSNKFVFKIKSNCNKFLLKKSIEKFFEVLIKDVNIINVIGKKKVFKTKVGYRNNFKKAIVTLKKGYSLDYSSFLDGV